MHPGFSDVFQFLFEAGDAVPDPSSVDFEFRFAGSPKADTAADPGQGRIFSDQPRQDILELRQFDLELPVPAVRMLGEDVEDQLSAVDDLLVGQTSRGSEAVPG